MTELTDLVGAYKREVAVPGAFATTFPLTTDADIALALADAFAEAQLDGLFHTMALDLDAMEVTPDLSTAGAALVVVYAGMRTVRQQIRAMQVKTRYKAGPVEAETGRSSAALVEDLKYLAARRDAIVKNARGSAATFVLDGYYARAGTNFYGGLFSYEVAQQSWGL